MSHRADVAENRRSRRALDAVAEALKASRLLLLTDVTGVLDANMELIQRITPSSADALVKEGIIKGGMIPKLQTAVQAVNNGCGGAAIVDGRIDHAVLEELFSDEGAGTLVVWHVVLFSLHELRPSARTNKLLSCSHT